MIIERNRKVFIHGYIPNSSSGSSRTTRAANVGNGPSRVFDFTPGRTRDHSATNPRYSRPPIVTANGDAMRALRAYNCDPRRDTSALDRVKKALMVKSALPDTKPKSRDEALRCVEAIKLFERNENALALRRMALRECPQFEIIDIEGVALSIHPDFLVDGGSGQIGAGILRVAKAPDPDGCKLDETRRTRRPSSGDGSVHRRHVAVAFGGPKRRSWYPRSWSLFRC